jgi:hypothetical protein
MIGTKIFMKPAKNLIVLLFILVCYLQSCEYDPAGIYERKVTKDMPPPEIQILDLNLDNDTVFLYPGIPVNFRFSSSNQAIKRIKFVVDDTIEKFIGYSNSGVFNLAYGEFTQGMHKLLLEIATASGTGSIAESIGAEEYLFSKTWKLNVNNSYKSQVKASVSNGFLKLVWPEYRSSDLKYYIVYKVDLFNNAVEIKKPKIAEFVDSSYVGEGDGYTINVYTQKGKVFTWGHIDMPKNLPKLSIITTETNQYVLKMTKSKYYNAVDTFKINQTRYYLDTYLINSIIKSTQNPNDTLTYLSNSFFGDELEFKLKLVPKYRNVKYLPDSYGSFESNLESVLGFHFLDQYSRIDKMAQVNHDEFVYVDYCYKLIRYSLSQKRTVEELQYQSSICSGCNFGISAFSSSGKFITNYAICSFDVMLIPSNNLKNYITRNIAPFSGNNYPLIFVSDNGTGIVNNLNGGFYVFDFNTNSSLSFYQKDTGEGTGLNISPDGKYIILTDDSLRLVHFNGSQFKDIWSNSITNQPKYFAFDAINSGHLVYWNGSVFSVKLCENFSNLYEFPLTDGSILNIDYYNEKILTYTPGSPGHMYVRSYTDGSLLKTIPVNMNPLTFTNFCYLINNAIVCERGLIYFIK